MGAEVLAGVALVGMLLACYRLGAERSAREAQAVRLSALEQVVVKQTADLRRQVESLDDLVNEIQEATIKQARLLEVHDRTIRGQSGHLTELVRQHQELVDKLLGKPPARKEAPN